MDKCENDKDLSTCEGCGHLGLYCDCYKNPEFNKMKETIVSDLFYFKTLDGHIAMTKEEYNILCRNSKVPIGALTTRQAEFNLKYGKGMEGKP